MPITSIDRYSAVSSSSASSSSSSSTSYHKNLNPYSTRFSPLRSASSSVQLSKLFSNDYRSMQSLKLPQYSHISPLTNRQTNESNSKDENWLSCEELETIEKRFTDLLQNSSNNYQTSQQRAKSCDRLTIDEQTLSKPRNLTLSRKSLIEKSDDQHRRSRIQLFESKSILSSNDILKIESSYRSIGTQVYSSRCICELYITTAERLAKLEDWIYFQHGLPVWLLNSGTNRKRQTCLSLILAEYGSGFPIWQETITGQSDLKQARDKHITFRLSDRITLAVLRFNDSHASKEFFSYYISIRNDQRYKQLFIQGHNRSSSCGSILTHRKKINQQQSKNLNKSSISNPCQFQHITSLQLKDRTRLISLNQCLTPAQNYSNELL